MNRKSLVLLAHGSRNPDWKAPFEELAQEICKDTGTAAIRLAYLQMEKPSLEDVVEELTAEGCTTIRILPMLMAAGNHALEDIPEEVAVLQAQHPSLKMEILPPIGSHDRFKTMMKNLVKELL